MIKHAHNRREKLFGAGRPLPLDRNAKVRVMTVARAAMRRTAKGKAWGLITAKDLSVLEALLFTFHNAKSGLCFPSLERIAEAAGCARSTVAKAIKALEAAGLVTWVNRLVRRREHDAAGWRWRVYRTSNGYRFVDPLAGQASKSESRSGTENQDSSFDKATAEAELLAPLEVALAKLQTHIQRPVSA
jgi:DNA-binding MarR family transcriptional regulator